MNIADVYASLSATALRKISGQKTSFSGPALQRLDLSAARRSLRMLSLSEQRTALRANGVHETY